MRVICLILIQLFINQALANKAFESALGEGIVESVPVERAYMLSHRVGLLIEQRTGAWRPARHLRNNGTIVVSPQIRAYDENTFSREAAATLRHFHTIRAVELGSFGVEHVNRSSIYDIYRANRIRVHANATHLILEGNAEIRNVLAILEEMKEQSTNYYVDKEELLGPRGARYNISAQQMRVQDVQRQVERLSGELKEVEKLLVKSIPNFDVRIAALDPITRQIAPELDTKNPSSKKYRKLLKTKSFEESSLGRGVRQVLKSVIKR